MSWLFLRQRRFGYDSALSGAVNLVFKCVDIWLHGVNLVTLVKPFSFSRSPNFISSSCSPSPHSYCLLLWLTKGQALPAKFSFSKFSGGLNIKKKNFENRHEASFYIKEQTQKNKFEMWVLKIAILDPRKSKFKVKKKKILCVFALIQQAIDAQMSFWSLFFERTEKKLSAVKKAF